MKIIGFNKKEGIATIRIDSTDDLWHLHKIIDSGDLVSGKSERKIKLGKEGDKQKVIKKTFTATIEVTKTDFSSDASSLRCSGKIVSEVEDIPMGSMHTVDVSPGEIIKIIKKKWLKYQIERLEKAESSSKMPKALLCVLDDDQANLGVLSGTGLKYLGRVTLGLVKKRVVDTKQKEKFGELISNIKEMLETSKANTIIIASPIFWKEELMKAIKEKDSELAGKVRLETVSTGAKKGLNELATAGSAEKLIKENQMNLENELVDNLLAEIGKQGLVVYGFNEAKKAAENSAVKVLLVTDLLIDEMKQKGKYDALESVMNLVEDSGGEVNIISYENEPGQKLHGLGGIAAKLRFKV